MQCFVLEKSVHSNVTFQKTHNAKECLNGSSSVIILK